MLTPLIAALLLASQAPASASAPPSAPASNPATRTMAQREAMARLAFLDGQWRGVGRMGSEAFTQTERVGSLLGGSIKLLEGRAYDGEGNTVFNAFATISYDPVKQAYIMRSHAMSYDGDFPLTVRPDGFSWVQPMGPGASIRYTATIKGDEWLQIGERIAGDAPPVKMFEMKLRRIGDSAWPVDGAVSAR